MKKFLIIALLTITSLGAKAQPPHRPLPNQFRDYVDFRKQQEKPKVEHTDGNVIITMSEEQFKRMQQMRMNQQRGFHPIVMRQQACSKCEHRHKHHSRRRK